MLRLINTGVREETVRGTPSRPAPFEMKGMRGGNQEASAREWETPDLCSSEDNHREQLLSTVRRIKMNLMRTGLLWTKLRKGRLMYHLKNNFCCKILRTGLPSNKYVTTEQTQLPDSQGCSAQVLRKAELKANWYPKHDCSPPSQHIQTQK